MKSDLIIEDFGELGLRLSGKTSGEEFYVFSKELPELAEAVAKAIEARRAATEGAVYESAAPKGFAR